MASEQKCCVHNERIIVETTSKDEQTITHTKASVRPPHSTITIDMLIAYWICIIKQHACTFRYMYTE